MKRKFLRESKKIQQQRRDIETTITKISEIVSHYQTKGCAGDWIVVSPTVANILKQYSNEFSNYR